MTNRAEWSHVSGANAVQHPQHKSDHVAGDDLMKVHAARFTLSPRSRSDYKIRASVDDGRDQPVHHLRTVAAVAIEKHDNLALRRDRSQSRTKRSPVSWNTFLNNTRAR